MKDFDYFRNAALEDSSGEQTCHESSEKALPVAKGHRDRFSTVRMNLEQTVDVNIDNIIYIVFDANLQIYRADGSAAWTRVGGSPMQGGFKVAHCGGGWIAVLDNPLNPLDTRESRLEVLQAGEPAR